MRNLGGSAAQLGSGRTNRRRGRPWRGAYILFASTLLYLAACGAEVADVETTDSISDDAIEQQSGGLSVGEKWNCIDQPSVPLIEEEETTALFRVVPLMGKVTVDNIEVYACNIEDPLCNEPVAGPFYTREDGTVAVATPTDPFIFFTFQHEDIIPAIVGGFIPMFPSDYVVEIGVFTSPQINGVLGLTGFENRHSDDTGHLLIVGHDCERNASADLRVSMNPESGELFYLRGTLPRRKEVVTDGSGTGGYIGTEPGYKTLSYEIAESSTPVASMTVPVRGGWVTEVYMTPHSLVADTSRIDDSILLPEISEE